VKLHEALATGLPFKRKADKEFRTVTNKRADVFSHEDVMAEDWQVDEPSVKVTRSSYWDAVSKIVAEGLLRGDSYEYSTELAKALGIEGVKRDE